METDSIFISGLDSSIVESELQTLFKPEIHGEFTITLHQLSFLDRSFILGELKLPSSESVAVYQRFSNYKLQSCHIKLLPKSSLKSLVVSNLPIVASEKDLFLILLRLTPGLKRIIIPENADIPGRTMGMIIANYVTHDHALHALDALKRTNNIFQKKVTACWKEPFTDVLGELSLETRTLYIKNIGFNVTIEEIRTLLEEYGTILRISKYATKAYVEFEAAGNAKKAMEVLNERRVKGTFWRIFPAKRFDSERFKEKNDKNLTFSKNFMDDFDQQKLLRFFYEGNVDETHTSYQIKAKNILDHAKGVLGAQIDALKTQYSSLKRENFDRHLPDKLSPDNKKKVHVEKEEEEKTTDNAAMDWHHSNTTNKEAFLLEGDNSNSLGIETKKEAND